MNIVGVIPARYQSTRLPGKPLLPIAGKPLLQWVVEGAKTSSYLRQIIVATDDSRIFDLATQLDVEAKMTAKGLKTGSDRVWQAVEDSDIDAVINIQGDEPLITGEILDLLAEVMIENPHLEMATLGTAMTQEDLQSVHTVKIVLNAEGEALYFSRLPIPYSRGNAEHISPLNACLKHIGLYAYRKEFLSRFCRQTPVEIEQAESLEQLRALYLGAKIKVVQVDHEAHGVDTPEDATRIEKLLQGR